MTNQLDQLWNALSQLINVFVYLLPVLMIIGLLPKLTERVKSAVEAWRK
ncbi:MAG: hypothetical protein QW599_05495 [Nitrososphaerota archaeon]